MEERFLYHIWDAGHLLTPLITASGKSLQVIYQGQFNTNRGPDFRNVILNLNGETLRGDVEIHLNCYDWIAHEHHEDPLYNNVILHVVMNAAKQHLTVKQNGEATEILELNNQLSDEIRKILKEPRPITRESASNYCELLSAVETDTLVSILNDWGMRRFRSKVRRFNASLLLSDFNQIFYEGLMEALGYDKNKHNLLHLAQAIPLKSLYAWKQAGMTALELVAILCCSSGLLDKCRKHLQPEFYTTLASTYEEQNFCAQKLILDWQLFRIRPAAHPIYRLISFGSLVYSALGQEFIDFGLALLQSQKSDVRLSFKAFTEAIQAASLPGGEKLPKPGVNLCGSMFVNILLPIGYLYFEKHSQDQAAQRVLDLYTNFQGLQENSITLHMSRYLSQSHYQLSKRKSILQQGLIEIFHRYCNYHLCAECRQSVL